MVGSVIVHKNEIIGEGWHPKAGENHAEVNAINAVKEKELLKKATIYVSLEPCSHYGKTPPCTNLIIEHGIKKIVIGTVDPFAAVAGKGIKKLLDAGCEVIVGVLEEECQELNKRFFTFHNKKRPLIILKWAESDDGFIAPDAKDQDRKPVWISNQYSRQRVHQWRANEQAILVGTNTAVVDNPKLNTRLWKGKNPVRIVLDQHLRIPADSFLFDKSTRTIVLTSASTGPKENSENLIFEPIDFTKEITSQICDVLYRYELQSVIIEGGSKTLQAFIDADSWDEARIFFGNDQLKRGVKAPELTGKLISEEKIVSDTLKIYRNDQDHNL